VFELNVIKRGARRDLSGDGNKTKWRLVTDSVHLNNQNNTSRDTRSAEGSNY